MGKKPPPANSGTDTREVRPRQYAAAFVRLKSRQEREAYWATIPEHLRAMVKKHVARWRRDQRNTPGAD